MWYLFDRHTYKHRQTRIHKHLCDRYHYLISLSDIHPLQSSAISSVSIRQTDTFCRAAPQNFNLKHISYKPERVRIDFHFFIHYLIYVSRTFDVREFTFIYYYDSISYFHVVKYLLRNT